MDKTTKKKKKKKPKTIPVINASDLDSNSRDDLKMYVTKLEKEIASMRKDRDFYNGNKDNIMDFLQTMRRVYVDQKQSSVVQNAHIDDLIEELRRFSEIQNEKAIIADKEKAKKKLEKKFCDFLERSTAKAENLDEEYHLKKQISDMDKCLQRNWFDYETALVEGKELFRKAQVEQDNKYSEFLQSSLKLYVNESLKAFQEFNSDKIKMLFSIWSADEQSSKMREPFINEVKDIENFFYEISLNNSEVIKMLKNQLENLLIEKKKLKISLNEVLLENVRLQEIEEPGFNVNNDMNTPIKVPNGVKNLQIKKKLEKLKFKNDVLQEELRNVEENWENLKKEFTKAVRKAYQKADFKTLVIEELIKKKLLMESVVSEDEEPESIPIQTPLEEEADAIDENGINVFSMTVEDSDTLYVPPVYHKSWDPSFKRQFAK